MSIVAYTCSDLIADFINARCAGKAFVVTGGACAFIIDAIGRSTCEFVCFQHEQSAAMAADAVWRTTGKVGVTVATSGPGATNLVTGIACSWFDSIPSIHITGQVNQAESRQAIGANVRQAGFQETDIVSMVSTITKFAKKIVSVQDLVETLPLIMKEATSGRMGPVLIDIPMNIQTSEVTEDQKRAALLGELEEQPLVESVDLNLPKIVNAAERPVVLIGAGAALAGSAELIQIWCESNLIPYVTSWGALSYIDRSAKNYFGSIGVYGSRRANWLIQAADELIVFGSRLDNRQRTANPSAFAPFSRITVIDVDPEELKKFASSTRYTVYNHDLKAIERYLQPTNYFYDWSSEVRQHTKNISDGFEASVEDGGLNPYSAVRLCQSKFRESALVVSDTGANLCWVYQSYLPDRSFLFTAAGNSPMGYSLPAAIGAQLVNMGKKVYCFIGDGGLQMNIQELQTIVNYRLPITIIILNNSGYGIIKQFQDSYLGSRYFATGEGYSVPDFGKIAEAYDIPYLTISSEVELKDLEIPKGVGIIDIKLHANSQITPKTEMDRFIHDQFPYIFDGSVSALPYPYPKKPSDFSTPINAAE